MLLSYSFFLWKSIFFCGMLVRPKKISELNMTIAQIIHQFQVYGDVMEARPHGSKMLTLIMATRFLADYLQGDTYYKMHRPGHNLDRCRTQLQLLRCLNQNKQTLYQIIDRIGMKVL